MSTVIANVSWIGSNFLKSQVEVMYGMIAVSGCWDCACWLSVTHGVWGHLNRAEAPLMLLGTPVLFPTVTGVL